MAIPKYDELLNPTFQAIRRLGGSASITEIEEEVIKSLNLSDADVSQPHDERRTEVEYRLAWARTYLKIYGLLENSKRGVWSISANGHNLQSVDPVKVRRFVHGQRKPKLIKDSPSNGITQLIEDVVSYTVLDKQVQIAIPGISDAILEQTWRESLMDALINLSPGAFERLCQRLLRESGFVQVQVTGKSGDGGIDGVGIVRIGGLLGFPVLFQCKRYKGSVGASTIRDFRGAMIGRTDRGLVITTGTFSRDAKREATRDGAPPIDLVDGEQLLDKLKELGLGVSVKMVEEVSVNTEWFKGL